MQPLRGRSPADILFSIVHVEVETVSASRVSVEIKYSVSNCGESGTSLTEKKSSSALSNHLHRTNQDQGRVTVPWKTRFSKCGARPYGGTQVEGSFVLRVRSAQTKVRSWLLTAFTWHSIRDIVGMSKPGCCLIQDTCCFISLRMNREHEWAFTESVCVVKVDIESRWFLQWFPTHSS